jgi:xylan 1,4-beta-xylosidase
MAWWWNRKPQYDGLFDFQNHVRPAYFTFLLLSRLTGQRINISTSDGRIHGLATWDPEIRKYSILFWNFSSEPLYVNVSVTGVPADTTAAREQLDSLAPSDDENVRLRPLPSFNLKPGTGEYPVRMQPYDVIFWELDSKSQR